MAATLKNDPVVTMQPQQQQPSRHRPAPTRPETASADTLLKWKQVLARCPWMELHAIEHWIATRPEFEGLNSASIIEQTGVLNRNMPDDFIEAVFGSSSGPPRRALSSLLADIQNCGVQLNPIEDALCLKRERSSVAIVKPSQDGLNIVTSVPVMRGSDRMKTAVYFVTLHTPLPIKLLRELGVSSG